MKINITFKKILNIFIGFIITCAMVYTNPMSSVAKATPNIPEISFASFDQTPYVEGNMTDLIVASKNYTGNVQYMLLYTKGAATNNMWLPVLGTNMSSLNGWTTPLDPQKPLKMDLSYLNFTEGTCKFEIRVKRYGITGVKSDAFGDYDSSYAFDLNTIKNSSLKLGGDMKINKDDFLNTETLKIDGIENSTTNLQYKLNLYDVKNDKWLTNLTTYSDKIEYSLSKLQTGSYIVSMWVKDKNSSNNYDGFKLAVINIKNVTPPPNGKPQVAIVSLDHTPFLEGDKNEFFIASKNYNYGQKVQYQLFYTCEATMGNKWQLIQANDMVNSWTTPTDAQQPVKIDISSLNLKAEYYRFAIRVKRYGVKGTYSNSYGDYDFAYPFTLNVLKNANVNLNGEIKINKNEFTQNEILKISGVQNSASNIEYKLHLYDVKNDTWITNLTEYTDKIDYDLSALQTGAYIVDVWTKTKTSNNKYDGWKLSVINITNETLPKVDLVSLDHSPFIQGDTNSFYVVSKNYTGKVQYQFFYTCESTMGNEWQLINNEDMVEGWTKEIDAHEPLKVDISNLNLKKEFYRFAIRVKRVGVKGTYENKYGDYDNAYPFNLTVNDKNPMTLNGDMIMDKDVFLKNDQLVVNGVTSTPSNTQYKLHLYDVQNNKWLTNLTDYSNSIDYDLSNIPERTYILNIWAKSTYSSKKYDGWKLKVIKVTSDLMNITKTENLSDSVSKNARYVLPNKVLATLENGSKKPKSIIWDSEAYTEQGGITEILGTVLGYNEKVKLTLNVENDFGNSFGNIMNTGSFADNKDNIYYKEVNDKNNLYYIDKKTNEISKLLDYNVSYMNISDDYIYYSGSRISRIKTNGTDFKVLSNNSASEMIVEKDWIYYSNESDSGKLYKIRTDGTSNVKISNDNGLFMNIVDDYIYYTNFSDNKSIYKIKKDGTGRTKLNGDSSEYINVINGWIYYSNASDGFKIYKVNINGTGRTKVTDTSGTYLNYSNGKLVFVNTKTHDLNYIDSSNQVKTIELAIKDIKNPIFISVIGDDVYFTNRDVEYNSGDTLFKVNITTKTLEEFGIGKQ